MRNCMRIMTTALAFLSLAWTGCSHGSLIEGGYILSGNDIKLLKSTTESIDYDFGYDSVNDLFYVYSFSHTGKNFPAKERELAKVINASEIADLQSFYYGVVRINMAIGHKVEFFKKREDWTNYTYFKNYLLRPAEEYREAVRKALTSKDASFFEFDKAAEARAAYWARWYYRDREEPVDTFP